MHKLTSDRNTPIPWVEVPAGYSDEIGGYMTTGIEMLDKCPSGAAHDVAPIIPANIPHGHLFCRKCLRVLAAEPIMPHDFHEKHGVLIGKADDGVILIFMKRTLVFKLARSGKCWRYFGPPTYEWRLFHGTFWEMLDTSVKILTGVNNS